MRYLAISVFLAAAVPCPAGAQIDKAGMGSRMDYAMDRSNKCLADFDTKAKAKKLSLDSYRAAIDGVCTTEISEARGLYSLQMENDPDQQYHLREYDTAVKDGRAKLVSAYAMR